MMSAYILTFLSPHPPSQQFYTKQFRNIIKLRQHFTKTPPPQDADIICESPLIIILIPELELNGSNG